MRLGGFVEARNALWNFLTRFHASYSDFSTHISRSGGDAGLRCVAFYVTRAPHTGSLPFLLYIQHMCRFLHCNLPPALGILHRTRSCPLRSYTPFRLLLGLSRAFAYLLASPARARRQWQAIADGPLFICCFPVDIGYNTSLCTRFRCAISATCVSTALLLSFMFDVRPAACAR